MIPGSTCKNQHPPPTTQGDIKWYLLLSVCWAVYNMIPPALFVFYCFDTSRERVRLQVSTF
jgi:hypothetical protein